jgi:hypothetical protein
MEIECMYAVQRRTESKSFSKWDGARNRYLLWLATSNSRTFAQLRDGIRVAPSLDASIQRIGCFPE